MIIEVNRIHRLTNISVCTKFHPFNSFRTCIAFSTATLLAWLQMFGDIMLKKDQTDQSFYSERNYVDHTSFFNEKGRPVAQDWSPEAHHIVIVDCENDSKAS